MNYQQEGFMRNALASFAGFVIVTALTVKSFDTEFGWAVAVGVISSAFLLVTSVYYMACAFGWTEQGRDYSDSEGEDEGDSEPENEPGQDSSQSHVAELDPANLKERVNFYAFVHGVTVNKTVSENAWAERGLPRATYRVWVKLLEDAGIVTATSQGSGRGIKMNFQQALEVIAVASGEGEDYWKPVRGYYNARPTEKSMLLLNENGSL